MTDAPLDQVVETLFALSARPSIRQDKTVRQHLRQAGALLAFPEEGLADHPLVKALMTARIEARDCEWVAYCDNRTDELEADAKYLRQRVEDLERQLAASRKQHLDDLMAASQRVVSRSISTNPEPLSTLGLQQGATSSDIRKRHRELMQIHHPDRGGRTEVMSRINAARDAALKTA